MDGGGGYDRVVVFLDKLHSGGIEGGEGGGEGEEEDSFFLLMNDLSPILLLSLGEEGGERGEGREGGWKMFDVRVWREWRDSFYFIRRRR
jgi:hypothetical protein